MTAMPKGLAKLGLRLRGARFVIVREEGATRVLRGPAPPRFVHACGDLLREADLDDAWVAQVGGTRPRLRFSDNVPDVVRQRIRNVWTPPPGPGREGARRRG
ncbi:hypothetical protein PC39_00075 [Salinisphaera sp. PC39]